MPRMLVEEMPRPGKEVEFKEWLVPARNNIQRQLLRLRLILEEKKGTPRVAVALNWLAGIGFSLWRAVFQVRKGLDSNAFIENSKSFLDEIILNNAALYTTELNTWSLGYYLGNARLRLVHLGRVLWPYDELPDELTELLIVIEKPMTWDARRRKRDPYQEWEDCFNAICLMLDEIEASKDI